MSVTRSIKALVTHLAPYGVLMWIFSGILESTCSCDGGILGDKFLPFKSFGEKAGGLTLSYLTLPLIVGVWIWLLVFAQRTSRYTRLVFRVLRRPFAMLLEFLVFIYWFRIGPSNIFTAWNGFLGGGWSQNEFIHLTQWSPDRWFDIFITLALGKFAISIIQTYSYYFLGKSNQRESFSKYQPRDVTVIIQSVGNFSCNGFLGRLEKVVSSILENDPHEILLCTIGQERANGALNFAQKVNKSWKDEKVKVILLPTASKRNRYIVTASESGTQITAYVDDHSTWPKSFLGNALAPFEDDTVGLVGTVKRAERTRSTDALANMLNYIACLSLEGQNFESTATYNLDGGVALITEGTILIRTSIIRSSLFKKEFLNEYYIPTIFFHPFFPYQIFVRTIQFIQGFTKGVGPMDVDAESYITRWMATHNMKAVFLNHPESLITITLSRSGFKQLMTQVTRSARTNWRSTSLIFNSDVFWLNYTWTTAISTVNTFFNFALFVDPMLFISLHNSGHGDRWGALAVALFVSKFIKHFEHLRHRNWCDLIFVFPGIMFGYFHSLIKLWAFLTADNIDRGGFTKFDTNGSRSVVQRLLLDPVIWVATTLVDAFIRVFKNMCSLLVNLDLLYLGGGLHSIWEQLVGTVLYLTYVYPSHSIFIMLAKSLGILIVSSAMIYYLVGGFTSGSVDFKDVALRFELHLLIGVAVLAGIFAISYRALDSYRTIVRTKDESEVLHWSPSGQARASVAVVLIPILLGFLYMYAPVGFATERFPSLGQYLEYLIVCLSQFPSSYIFSGVFIGLTIVFALNIYKPWVKIKQKAQEEPMVLIPGPLKLMVILALSTSLWLLIFGWTINQEPFTSTRGDNLSVHIANFTTVTAAIFVILLILLLYVASVDVYRDQNFPRKLPLFGTVLVIFCTACYFLIVSAELVILATAKAVAYVTQWFIRDPFPGATKLPSIDESHLELDTTNFNPHVGNIVHMLSFWPFLALLSVISAPSVEGPFRRYDNSSAREHTIFKAWFLAKDIAKLLLLTTAVYAFMWSDWRVNHNEIEPPIFPDALKFASGGWVMKQVLIFAFLRGTEEQTGEVAQYPAMDFTHGIEETSSQESPNTNSNESSDDESPDKAMPPFDHLGNIPKMYKRIVPPKSPAKPTSPRKSVTFASPDRNTRKSSLYRTFNPASPTLPTPTLAPTKSTATEERTHQLQETAENQIEQRKEEENNAHREGWRKRLIETIIGTPPVQV